MKSLKPHLHWLVLTVVAAGSIGATGLLLKEEQDLPATLEKLQPKKPASKRLPPPDLSGFETAYQELRDPGLWNASHETLLFVSEAYLLGANGLERPKEGSLHRYSKTGEPIPNSWFLQHKLPLRSPKVPTDDPDDDGFTNEEEWYYKTNPTDPNSHPPLRIKLYFVEEKETHARIAFLQYLGGADKKPEDLNITVKLLDLPNQPQLDNVHVGQKIPGTSFKVARFTHRENTTTGITGFKADASVISVVDEKTGQEAAAELKGKAADFLDKTITLNLRYPKENRMIVCKPGQKVVLAENEVYTLLDSSPAGAVLKDAENKEYEVKVGSPE
jgi:hypothetical protein